MKLFYIADSQIPGRSANSMQVINMCAAFQSVGADVILVCPEHQSASLPEGYEGDLWQFYGIKESFRIQRISIPISQQLGHMKIASRIIRSLTYPWFLWRIIGSAEDGIIFYGRSGLALWWADKLKRLWKLKGQAIKLYMEVHDFPHSSYLQQLLSRLDGVVVISQILADDLIEKVGLSAQQIIVEHDGVALFRHSYTQNEARESFCQRFQLNPECPLAIYTGRVNKQKGAELLLATANKLKDSGCQIVLVGKVYDASYQAQIESQGWSHVHMTGFLPPAQIPLVLAAADILLLPSTSDLPYANYMSPLKLFEYMAAERPIVASDLPVLREVLQNQYNALLVSIEDADGWAEAISQLIEQPELGQRLSSQARKDVENYAWTRRAERILNHLSTNI